MEYEQLYHLSIYIFYQELIELKVINNLNNHKWIQTYVTRLVLNKSLIWLMSLLIDCTIVEQRAVLTSQCDCWMAVAHVAMKANWKKWNFVLRSVTQFCQHLWSVFAVNSMFAANSLLATLARAGKFAVIYHLLKHLSDKVRYFK